MVKREGALASGASQKSSRLPFLSLWLLSLFSVCDNGSGYLGLVWLLCFELCAFRILALGVGVIVGVSLRNLPI
jgi:hypothetical protein